MLSRVNFRELNDVSTVAYFEGGIIAILQLNPVIHLRFINFSLNASCFGYRARAENIKEGDG